MYKYRPMTKLGVDRLDQVLMDGNGHYLYGGFQVAVDQLRYANELVEALQAYSKLLGGLPMSIRYPGTREARDSVEAKLKQYLGEV